MRVLNDLLINGTTVALSQNSDVLSVEHIGMADVMAYTTAANPSNKTFDTGTMEVQTLTFPDVAGSTAGDYIVFYDQSGTAWAVSLDKAGTDPEPTGAAWVAIDADHKVHVDISGGTDAASVAALVETAVDGLTGFTDLIVTDDTAANGTMLLTQTVPGPTTNPVPHNADDSGAGSITGVQTTAGVATEVSLADNTASIPSHGLTTGVKFTLTTTGTLPAGLATATPYYAIVVSSSLIKFASSQANALAGTAVDITDYGTSAAVHTLVIDTTIAGSVKLQKSDEPGTDEYPHVWFDVGSSSQNFSGSTTLNWGITDIGYRALRAVVTVTSGTVTVRVRVNAKGF